MKIFLNGCGFREFVETFRNKGHKMSFGPCPWFNFVNDDKKWHTYNTKILKDAISEAKPDVYLCSKGFRNDRSIYPETMRWIEKNVGITAYWSLDDPFFIPTFLQREMFIGYKIALSCTTSANSQYKKVGMDPYLFWPAWDKLDRVVTPTKEKDKTDLVFIGSPYGCTDIPRKDIILWAIKEKLSVKVFGGNAWISDKVRGKRMFLQGDHRIKPYYHGEFRNWRKLHNLFGQGRITFSNHVVKANMYLNDRVPLVMGVGGCLLLDGNPGLNKAFKHNKEVVFYDDFATFKHRALYFLKRPDYRKELGKAAQKKILKEHTYEQRANRFLEILKIYGFK